MRYSWFIARSLHVRRLCVVFCPGISAVQTLSIWVNTPADDQDWHLWWPVALVACIFHIYMNIVIMAPFQNLALILRKCAYLVVYMYLCQGKAIWLCA